MTTRHPRRLLAVALTAFTLLAAACGDDSTVDTSGGDDLGQRPADDQQPPAADTCLEGTADCNDTPADLDRPNPEPGEDPTPDDPTELPQPLSGVLVDGGLSVEEALGRGPDDGVIAVKGVLYQDDTGTYLCGTLAESFPPQCGGGLLIEGFDVESLVVPLNSSQGISWTDTVISLLGRVDNGVLTVDPTVVG